MTDEDNNYNNDGLDCARKLMNVPPGTKFETRTEICFDSPIPAGAVKEHPFPSKRSSTGEKDKYRKVMPKRGQGSTDGPFYDTQVSELDLSQAQAELIDLTNRSLLKRWHVRVDELKDHIAAELLKLKNEQTATQ